MSQKHFQVVESLLKSVPREVAKSAGFRERFKVFVLHKWAEKDAWHTDEPRLVLATLQDNAASLLDAEGFIQQAAAQVRRRLFFCFYIFFNQNSPDLEDENQAQYDYASLQEGD